MCLCPWSQGPAPSPFYFMLLPKAEMKLIRAEDIKTFSATPSCFAGEEKGPREGESSAQGHTALGGPAFTGTSKVLSGSSDAALPLSLNGL